MAEFDKSKVERVLDVYRDLALSMKGGTVDTVQFMAYYMVLADFEVEDIARAAKRLLRRQDFFPSAKEWADEILRGVDIAPAEDPDTVHCAACDDTGFLRGDTGVRKCHCRATNPVLARERLLIARRQV